MSESVESALRRTREELQSIYEGSSDGVLAVDAKTRRFVRANPAICELLGYSEEELLTLSVADIHPPESLPAVLEAFEAMRKRQLRYGRDIPCLRKDGTIIRVDIGASYLGDHAQPMLIGFFRNISEQKRMVELLRASEERYRLVTDNVADVIWTSAVTLSDAERALAQVNVAAVVDAVLERWQFSFVSPAVERVLGYTPEDAKDISIRDSTIPASYHVIRNAMIANFMPDTTEIAGNRPDRALEVELVTKGGSILWCEVVSTYLRDKDGYPTHILGVARDISGRRNAQQAMRDSENKLRSLIEFLPDLVLIVDRNAIVYFINRSVPNVNREELAGVCAFEYIVPEHQQACRDAVAKAFSTGQPQNVDALDIFGGWWSCRVVSMARDGDAGHAMVIATDVTQGRLASEAVGKEQRLLRRLLDLHERDRRLTAYDIHDGFAQQLTGAMYRLQGFREAFSRDPEKAWEDFDSAVRLIGRSIDETRRLISGLRPPILDESGILDAIEYLVCERGRQSGIVIEFVHNVYFDRLAPPLESALFRIVQESLQNACRHSRSDKVRIELTQKNNRIHLEVRDWGVGFSPENIEEQRFGLQGIRERTRLLGGSVTIESTPGKGTQLAVELPLIDSDGDMMGND